MSWQHHLIACVALFGLGACVGSFLNVCICRIPRGQSVLRPRSRCPKCGRAIGTRDNVPIVGWLMLRGKCRHCGLPISARYPAIEGLVGLLFGAAYAVETWLHGGDLFDHDLATALLRLAMETLLASLVVACGFIVGDGPQPDPDRGG